jgi:oligopeptide/dipeptide ABC transporter ATP-binding protein
MNREHTETLLDIRNLCKYFPIRSKGFFARQIGVVKAVDNVSFTVQKGETIGIVGESGSGKTTCARTILRALKPTDGAVLFYEKQQRPIDLSTVESGELKRLRTKIQMVFQDPYSSLNPRMTVGDIIGEPLLIHRIGTKSERRDRVMQMLRKVGLKPEHMHRYPHAFSGGQRQRIGIARALILNPLLIIADEPVSALDVSVQAQVINLLEDLQEEFHLTNIFIAHDLAVVRHICDRIAVMYAGKLVECGRTGSVFNDPKHPYTKALLSAIPYPDPEKQLQFTAPGDIADPAHLPPGCSFHPRCPSCFDRCSVDVPSLREYDNGRLVSCHLYNRQEHPSLDSI